MQKVRYNITDHRYTISRTLHPSIEVLFTFPSQYLSTIGHKIIFKLKWWSTYIPTGFHETCFTHQDL